MRALVTGSSGFVGQHLVTHLRAQGDDVVALDRTDGIDIRNRDAIHAAIAAAGPDVVYHLAGQSDVAASWQNRKETEGINVEGTHNVAEASAAAGVHRLLVVSSALVYGHVEASSLPIDEDRPTQPVSPYAASKVGAESVASVVGRTTDLDVVIARPFNHIGPGQRTNFVASGLAQRIAKAAADGADSIEAGSLSPTRDFLDVRDVVRAYRMMMVSPDTSGVYNVCSGLETSIEEIAHQLIDISGANIRLDVAEHLLRPTDLPRICGDNRRLRTDTGWQPQVSLEASLADVYREQAQQVEADRRSEPR